MAAAAAAAAEAALASFFLSFCLEQDFLLSELLYQLEMEKKERAREREGSPGSANAEITLLNLERELLRLLLLLQPCYTRIARKYQRISIFKKGENYSWPFILSNLEF